MLNLPVGCLNIGGFGGLNELSLWLLAELKLNESKFMTPLFRRRILFISLSSLLLCFRVSPFPEFRLGGGAVPSTCTLSGLDPSSEVAWVVNQSRRDGRDVIRSGLGPSDQLC